MFYFFQASEANPSIVYDTFLTNPISLSHCIGKYRFTYIYMMIFVVFLIRKCSIEAPHVVFQL